jgi:hypothetical protein
MAYSLKNRRYRSRRAGQHTVTELRAENDYMLWLRFEDGVEGRVYLGHLMTTAAYGAQVDEKDFFKVLVDPVSRAVMWEGGVYLDADMLYRNLAIQGSAPLH